jgi:hypothetical protein
MEENVMRKLFTALMVISSGLAAVFAQVTLDPNKFVNTQIAADTLANGSHDPAKKVYRAESGKIYAFDGTLFINFDLTISGPDNTWIKNQTAPPLFLQIPAANGTGRDMMNLRAGGSIRIKNVVLDGNLSNGNLVGAFVINAGGYKMIFDNCAFGECMYFTSRNQAVVDTLSYTNCLFINMVRKASTPFNGMLTRVDAACRNFIFENNTSVNSSRLFGNGGDFFTSKNIEMHNTFLNMQVNGHELHWFESLQANNIYYNWSYRGRNLKTNGYEAPFTTWDFYYTVQNKLDSISLYEGMNAFYLDPAFPDYWNKSINPLVTNDSLKIIPCYLWPTGADTTIKNDNNFKIGKNYWQFDPVFTKNPSKVDSMCAWDNYYWAGTLKITGLTSWPDWRADLVVSFDAQGQPILNWPPKWDLSYANATLKKAGTDGLPLGDLNWFPASKATYLANRNAYIAALRDSMVNAKYLYIPGDAESAKIKEGGTSVKNRDGVAGDFELSRNYPNPFNPTTTVTIKLAKSEKISFKVYDVLGQLVKTVIDNKTYTAGAHLVAIDMADHGSGVYFTVLSAGSQKIIRKITLMK